MPPSGIKLGKLRCISYSSGAIDVDQTIREVRCVLQGEGASLTKDQVNDVVSTVVVGHAELSSRWKGGEWAELLAAAPTDGATRQAHWVNQVQDWLTRNTRALTRTSARSVINTARHEVGQDPSVVGYRLLEAMAQVNSAQKSDGQPEDFSVREMANKIKVLYANSGDRGFAKRWCEVVNVRYACDPSKRATAEELICSAQALWTSLRESPASFASAQELAETVKAPPEGVQRQVHRQLEAQFGSMRLQQADRPYGRPYKGPNTNSSYQAAATAVQPNASVCQPQQHFVPEAGRTGGGGRGSWQDRFSAGRFSGVRGGGRFGGGFASSRFCTLCEKSGHDIDRCHTREYLEANGMAADKVAAAVRRHEQQQGRQSAQPHSGQQQPMAAAAAASYNSVPHPISYSEPVSFTQGERADFTALCSVVQSAPLAPVAAAVSSPVGYKVRPPQSAAVRASPVAAEYSPGKRRVLQVDRDALQRLRATVDVTSWSGFEPTTYV